MKICNYKRAKSLGDSEKARVLCKYEIVFRLIYAIRQKVMSSQICLRFTVRKSGRIFVITKEQKAWATRRKRAHFVNTK
jgi:hypothetical protein